MPRRDDISSILIIGAGPIIIGQACEFDYSGAQACKALKAEGYRVILVNSNPATIMTDPEMADRTYIEPLTPEVVTRVIEQERPDALLPTMGGQTALNLAVTLAENGTLKRCGVELIGADLKAIQKAEDRLLFKQAMERTPDQACPGNARRGDDGRNDRWRSLQHARAPPMQLHASLQSLQQAVRHCCACASCARVAHGAVRRGACEKYSSRSVLSLSLIHI